MQTKLPLQCLIIFAACYSAPIRRKRFFNFRFTSDENVPGISIREESESPGGEHGEPAPKKPRPAQEQQTAKKISETPIEDKKLTEEPAPETVVTAKDKNTKDEKNCFLETKQKHFKEIHDIRPKTSQDHGCNGNLVR